MAYQLLHSFPVQEWEVKERRWVEARVPELRDPSVGSQPPGWGGGSNLTWNNSSDGRFTPNQLKQHSLDIPIDMSPDLSP